MKSPITCCTWSRFTARRLAMALPTRCTSFGPMCRSTAAASDSPRLSRKIAALSSLVSFCVRFSSLIGIDPLLDYLGNPTRVLGQQALDRIELLLVTGARWRQQYGAARRAGQAHGVVTQVISQQRVFAQRRVVLAVRTLAVAAADALEHRPQHAEDQHQHEQDAQYLLGDIPEPGLGPDGYLRHLHLHAVGRHEGTVDDTDAVTPGLIIPHRVPHQLSQIGQLGLAQRHAGHLAGFRVELLAVIHHYCHGQPGQAALLLAGIADLAVQFEVAGGLLAGIPRRGGHHRLTGLRIDDLLRYLGGARWLVAQGAGNADRPLPCDTLLG